MGTPPAEFGAMHRADLARWTKVTRDLKIRADAAQARTCPRPWDYANRPRLVPGRRAAKGSAQGMQPIGSGAIAPVIQAAMPIRRSSPPTGPTIWSPIGRRLGPVNAGMVRQGPCIIVHNGQKV